MKATTFRITVSTIDGRRFIFHRTSGEKATVRADHITRHGFRATRAGALRFYPASSVRVATVTAHRRAKKGAK